MLTVILEMLTLPTTYAGGVRGVNILVDRITTLLNVTGAAVACMIINNFARKKRVELSLSSEGMEKMQPQIAGILHLRRESAQPPCKCVV
jgi:Na+/H+-dicarboxylate symporter